MVDNFDKIKSLLNWRFEDDFYFLQILQRKKDHKKGKVNGGNNNSRLIKAYYIKSLEHLDFIKPEIIELCKVFNARANINLNRRSWKRTQLQTMKIILDHQLNQTFNKTHTAFDSVCGKYSNETNKKWIIDLDEPYQLKKDYLFRLQDRINNLQPEGNKIITILPSKSGLHIISKPFNIQKFREFKYQIEIHKNNPTNLYIV